MDDLISRKSVVEVVDRHTRDDGTLDDDISVILEEVETAFDKEKVIEDLNDWLADAEKWADKYDESEGIAASCYRNAIDIVNKAGLN